jgi:hypothetical protein
MKFNLKISIAGMLVVLGFLPLSAFAKEPTKTNAKNETTAFCTRLSAVQQKMVDQIIKAETKQSTNEANREVKIAKNESDIDARRAEGRAEADGKRLKNWDKMISKAKTGTQKQSVEAYTTSIQIAVATRRASIDSAVKIYRDSLTALVGTHNSTIDQAVAEFKASVDAALAKARADCAANLASKTVKDTFNTAIDGARKALQADRKTALETEKMGTLKTIRNEAIKIAEATFKTATEKARADLILALKK